MKISFTIEGEPMGKERPKATTIGGHAKVYTPKKTANYEAKVGYAFRQAYPNAEPLATALHASIYCYFPLNKGDYTPNGKPTKKGRAKLSGEIAHTKKPDCDNLAKSVLDGLNGLAFVDDSQIISLTVVKYYSVWPRVQVVIGEFFNDDI